MTTVIKMVEVDVPARTAYNQWTQFEDFPTFMEGVEEVQQLDDRHLHWRANIGGKLEEWTAEITEQIPDKRIAWRSLAGAENAGVVTFHHLAADRARVTLQVNYETKTLSEAVGSAFGLLERRIEGDLDRFKTFIEAHRQATGAWRGKVTLPEDAAAPALEGASTGKVTSGEENAEDYNREAEKFAESDKGEKAAAEAARALDGPEGVRLRQAERVGHERATRRD